jgi:hypothetical protein
MNSLLHNPDKYNVDDVGFIHFGDNCASGIIINNILNIPHKLPFMLARFYFESIINIMKNNFDGMYDEKNLVLGFPEDKKDERYTDAIGLCRPIRGFESVIKKYGNDDDIIIYNTLYDTTYRHHFVVDEDKILNYDFVVDQGQKKIENYYRYVDTKKLLIFINFQMKDKKEEDILWFEEHLKSQNLNYKLIIFTYNDIESKIIKNNNIITITPEKDWNDWWLMDEEKQQILYEHLYNLFIRAVDDVELPEFNNTMYGIKNIQKQRI